ncbi:hypothetical protein LINPERHAP1_LOCUS29167, partial [Linum perenne]
TLGHVCSFSGFRLGTLPVRGFVCRAVWTAVVAGLWKERCARVHGRPPVGVDDLAKFIIKDLAYQALGDSVFSSAVSFSGFQLVM